MRIPVGVHMQTTASAASRHEYRAIILSRPSSAIHLSRVWVRGVHTANARIGTIAADQGYLAVGDVVEVIPEWHGFQPIALWR